MLRIIFQHPPETMNHHRSFNHPPTATKELSAVAAKLVSAVALSVSALMLSGVAEAATQASVDAGHTKYSASCSGCHGATPSAANAVSRGANLTTLTTSMNGSFAAHASFGPSISSTDLTNLSNYIDWVINATPITAAPATGGAGTMSLSSTQLTFSTTVNASTSQSVTVTNTGSTPISFTSFAISGANPTMFSTVGSTCTTTTPLAAGATCQILAGFAPTSTGSMAAVITVNSNAPTATVGLAGTATAAAAITPGAAITATPNPLDFGGVVAGAPQTKTFTVTNSGGSPDTFYSDGTLQTAGVSYSVQISNIAVTGLNSLEFQQTNNCGTLPFYQTSCSVTVTFTPPTNALPGTRTATMNITSNAGVLSVPLSANIQAAVATSSIAAMNFGNIGVGATSPAQAATITNTGNVPLVISSITQTQPFNIDPASTCLLPANASMAPNQSCTLVVSMSPTGNLSYSGALLIQSNSATVTIALSGCGGSATCSSGGGGGGGTPSGVTLTGSNAGGITSDGAFGFTQMGATSSSQTFTFTNGTSSPLNLTSITTTDGFFQTSTCSATLAAGASCAITVTFSPNSEVAYSGQLTVTHDGPGGVTNLALSGTGSPTGGGVFNPNQPSNVGHVQGGCTISSFSDPTVDPLLWLMALLSLGVLTARWKLNKG